LETEGWKVYKDLGLSDSPSSAFIITATSMVYMLYGLLQIVSQRCIVTFEYIYNCSTSTTQEDSPYIQSL